jgi:cellobiose-specific phosphotransferase system component IIC
MTNTITETVDYMTDKISPVLEKLADTLNTSVEFLWSVLVRQAMVSGIANIIIGSILIFCIYLLFTKGIRTLKMIFNKDSEVGVIATVVFSMVAFIFSLIIIFNIKNTVTCLINPEYWALNEILEKLKG